MLKEACKAGVWALGVALLVGGFAVVGYADDEDVPPPPVPDGYKGKKMPAGWWKDPQIIEAGKQVYVGKANEEVKCAECHGEDGEPTRKGRGARDFRKAQLIDRMSDDFWFWRISEGVPKTKMKGLKDLLTEEQRWQVMAYEYTFSKGAAKPRE